MIQLLQVANEYDYNSKNIFAPDANMEFYDSILNRSLNQEQLLNAWYGKAEALLQLGEELKAIEIYEKLIKKISVINFDKRALLMKDLAAAYLRLGERTNCIHNHSAESCIFPITLQGVHRDKTGSEKAIEIYTNLLFDNPNDLESKWLMNIAYMTVGKYPNQVPASSLIKLSIEDSMHAIKPFTDVAANVGLNLKDMAGGSIVDDFNNDGYLDIIKSSWDLKEHMHYCKNNGNGTFTDMSEYSGLIYLTGGSNIMQTDYNNDGFKDIFVLRGGWRGKFGKHPNSLLRNNGDDTFTDVTKEAGLLSFYPTMTATWADFNNDGWLDVFIGNETNPTLDDVNTCELYLNNKTGTF